MVVLCILIKRENQYEVHLLMKIILLEKTLGQQPL